MTHQQIRPRQDENYSEASERGGLNPIATGVVH